MIASFVSLGPYKTHNHDQLGLLVLEQQAGAGPGAAARHRSRTVITAQLKWQL
jgi:hypothetical protein